MRSWPLLLSLMVAACGDQGMTRNFNVSRDSAPETIGATQVPLSTPPGLTIRPTPPVLVGASGGDSQPANQATGSAGEEALVQDAGPPAEGHIRRLISENSGLVYPGPDFVGHLMNWTPPPGHTPIITQGSSGGWFSRMF